MVRLFKSKWGQWTDLSTGAIHETRYLLQARRHKNGKVQFRVEKVRVLGIVINQQ